VEEEDRPLNSPLRFLDLVEEYPREFAMTQFEKVLVASKRAKALHAGKDQLVVSDHNPTYVALDELNQGAIRLVYKEEPVAMIEDENGDEGDEEE